MFKGQNDSALCHQADGKDRFLEQTKCAREERAKKQSEIKAAINMQKCIRCFLAKRRFAAIIRKGLDEAIGFSDDQIEYRPALIPAVSVYPHAKRYMMFAMKSQQMTKRFEYLCKYILNSLNSDMIKMNYLSVMLNKTLAVTWIDHIKQILVCSMRCLTQLKPESVTDMKSINTLLTMLISFTSTTNWKFLSGQSGDVLRPAMNQLCTNFLTHIKGKQFYPCIEVLLNAGIVKAKPCFKSATLSAIFTLLLRVHQTDISSHTENGSRELLLHVLSVPSLMYHMEKSCHDMYIRFLSDRIFTQCLNYLSHNDHLQAVAVTLEGNRTLSLIGNLLQLGLSEKEGIVDNIVTFNNVLNKLLQVCGQFMVGKGKTSKSHWHPILGWSNQPFDYNEAVPFLMKQLQLLWDPKIVSILFCDLNEFTSQRDQSSGNDKKSAQKKRKSDKKGAALKLDSNVIVTTCSACSMYQSAISVLVHIQAEILSGLAFNPTLLKHLWLLMSSLGNSTSRVKVILEALSNQRASSELAGNCLTSIPTLFCDAAIMLFMILDDVEMYEEEKPFALDDLITLSDMLNQLVFKMIYNDVVDWKHAETEPLFTAAHSLLQLLHERDSRRSFSPLNHWIIKDIRPAQFISSIDKGNKTSQFLLQKMPHIIGHKDRVVLFRKLVMNEKESLGISDSMHTAPNITYMTISRRRILEDGYSQLAEVAPLALKGLIRVKFVNYQGLDEAGIDQDGVFKEFLEETIKKVFDPGLNLFKVTDEQKLYPSPTSSLQDNHLKLFEFVGRILGKAVYEGIVVDVPFAPFFLTQVLDNMKNSMYSYLDELPSLDPELYKNLTYVKHYEGDIEDLELNFSYDEDFMGQVNNYELKPGGKAITVTNENKISYVHYMARFKMHTRIKAQTQAFTRGFKSIINYDWLRMFSTQEVQKLISGDTVDIDLADLRKHTQYYGGFHNSHRVVNWLWDILEKEFTETERGQFLKFVTSCSKPPLLGFAQLDPPFSIRCVEVADDQDTGDTIGSILKGFFSIRRNEPAGRLPTSSTCFNLLKLPNYSKKKVLKDKLRYSILNNTGFELS